MKKRGFTWMVPVLVFATGLLLFTNEGAKKEHQTAGLVLAIAAIILFAISLWYCFFSPEDKTK